MTNDADILKTLQDPEVEKVLLTLLKSGFSAEEKLHNLKAFFKDLAELKHRVLSGPPSADSRQGTQTRLSVAARDIGIWNPDEMLATAQQAAQRAIHWIFRRQREDDGGWGRKGEGANVWATSHALMSLSLVNENVDPSLKCDRSIDRGLAWLLTHRDHWCVADVQGNGVMPVYEGSLAVLCLHHLGFDRVGQDLWRVGEACVEKLAESQNRDGGWDDKVWGPEVYSPTRVWSDVGATSMATQAFAVTDARRYESNISNGAQWLLHTQDQENAAGSWHSGSCTPEEDTPQGDPKITKTCDGVKALLAAKTCAGQLNLPHDKSVHRDNVVSAIDRAVTWILGREQLLTEDRGAAGWGFERDLDDYLMQDLDSTCLVLETLLKTDDPSLLPPLTMNARWLIQAQNTQGDPDDDGKWLSGDTYRITLGLIEYCAAVRRNLMAAPALASAGARSR